jgi:hypothetical protein
MHRFGQRRQGEVRLHNRDLFQQILSCHAHIVQVPELTSKDTPKTMLYGHNIG